MTFGSINNIIQTATSGLIANQAAMSVTSTNITNAETVGYTAKSADRSTTVVGGQGVGVSIVGINNSIDKVLAKAVVEAESEATYDETVASYLNTILSALGSTDTGVALEDAMTTLMTVLSEAANAGGSADAADDVTEALDTWAGTLQNASTSVQAVRTAADEAIGEVVEDVNSLLTQLDSLNDQIARASTAGETTADLFDSQRQALDSLAELIDISYFTTPAGEARIYSSGGTALLTSVAATLSYTPFGTLTADATYDASGTGTISGITVNGDDVTSTLGGGELGALVALRDSTLPGLQDELDALALGVADSVNAAANDATPIPAPDPLTSAATVTGTDAFAGTGTLTVLDVDADGTVVSSTDIDLTTVTTYADLVTALDGAAGVSATLDADGHVVLTADSSGNGVVLTGDTEVTADGRSLSHHLGFTSMLAGTGASDISVADGVATQGLAVAAVASTTVGETALADGDTAGFQAIWSALDGAIGFDAAGELAAAERSAVSQIAALVDDLADRTEAAEDTADASATMLNTLSTAFDNAHGVNVDEETADLLALQQSYEAVAQVISTAQDMFDSLLGMMR